MRECLKGQARKLVPDSNVTDVKTAWEILKKAFGNPIKIIKQRKEALLKLGEMPSGKVKGQKDLRPQIAWFIEVTTFLKELIELGKKNSEYRDLAFNKEFEGQKIIGLLLIDGKFKQRLGMDSAKILKF